MAINPSDVVILRSERFTDEPDGGGAMTGTVIPNGVVNNLWDDISRDVLAFGGVSLREMFCAIRSANVDKALGGHVIVLKDSDASNVSTILFETGGHYDERSDAQQAIEQFVVLGTRSVLRPVGTQRKGQTSIVVYADSPSDEPEIGEVLILKSKSTGIEQPVKITRVDGAYASYAYIDKSGYPQRFRAYQMTLKITQELQHEFSGTDPEPAAKHDTELFTTQSNSSARYYGIKPLAQPAVAGERTVVVDSIFSPLVPAATTEQAILDQRPGLLSNVVEPTGDIRSLALGSYSGAALLTLPQSWVPGSLRLTIGSSVYADDGTTLRLISGTNNLTADAVISATRATISLSLASNYSISAQFLPGVAVELMPYTARFEITAGNRQLTYTDQLAPKPMPGSVRVEFQYLGRWYTLSDDGNSKLTGPASSGSVNYETGSISYTLPGEPDEGSKILTTWSRSPYMTFDTGALDAWLVVDLPSMPAAGTVSLSWQRSGGSYSATADSSDNLSGAATGYVRGQRVYMRPSSMPTSDISVNYEKLITGPQIASVPVAAQTGGTITLDLGATDIVARAVKFTLKTSVNINTQFAGVVTKTNIKKDWACNCAADNRVVSSGLHIGDIDPVTGVITLNASALTTAVREYVQVTNALYVVKGDWATVIKTLRVESQMLNIEYISTSSTEPVTHSQALEDTNIEARLDNSRPLLPGSVLVSIGGQELSDGGDGYLYRNWNYSTAAGIQAGLLDYADSVVVIPYAGIQSLITNLNSSLLCAAGGIGAAAAVQSVVFRTSASPLRTSGLQFLARRAADGALMRAQSGNDGAIVGSFDTNDVIGEFPQPGTINGYTLPIIPENVGGGTATGTVDNEAGVVEIQFSQPVILSTLTYNAVAYTTVPLSPEIIGLNPVRLPTNGNVPIFKPGYMVVLHNTQTLDVAAPAAGQVIDCGRTNLAVVTIQDASGVDLDPTQYTLDRAAGTVTLSDPFTAQDTAQNSLTLPLTVTHRIEDVAALGGVDVGGSLQLLTELNHDYPAGASYVSSAIHFGVMQARITNVRDKQIDDGDFDGSGNDATGTYDTVNYPILIDNNSSVEDRWKLKFTSATAFQCISERRGVIGTGATNSDYSPINPYTGQPYFTIKKDGWGSGWVSNNVLLFDTVAAAHPFWAIRTALPSNLPAPKDSTIFEFRAEAD